MEFNLTYLPLQSATKKNKHAAKPNLQLWIWHQMRHSILNGTFCEPCGQTRLGLTNTDRGTGNSPRHSKWAGRKHINRCTAHVDNAMTLKQAANKDAEMPCDGLHTS